MSGMTGGSLDERANRARRSIGDTTRSVPVPEFEPPGRPFSTVAAVVFTALLAIGGVLAIRQGDEPRAADIAADGPDAVSATEEGDAGDLDEDDDTGEDAAPGTDGDSGSESGGDPATAADGTDSVDPPPVEVGAYLVFDPAPEGFEPLIFSDAGVVTDEMLPTFDVYGSEGGAPFADGDLLVGFIPLATGEDLVTDPDTPTVEVDGELIHLEEDELFNVVSWQRGTEGVGVLSHTFTQDELVAIMTNLIRTGEVDSRGLTLLAEGLDFTEARSRFLGPVVAYEAADREALWADADGEPVITAILVNSEPVEPSLLTVWFGRSDGFAETIPTETVEHDGVTIETGVSIEGGRFLRFEVDGVLVDVTMLAEPGPGAIRDTPTPPPIEDALALLGPIRAATEAEVEAMTARGSAGG